MAEASLSDSLVSPTGFSLGGEVLPRCRDAGLAPADLPVEYHWSKYNSEIMKSIFPKIWRFRVDAICGCLNVVRFNLGTTFSFTLVTQSVTLGIWEGVVSMWTKCTSINTVVPF